MARNTYCKDAIFTAYICAEYGLCYVSTCPYTVHCVEILKYEEKQEMHREMVLKGGTITYPLMQWTAILDDSDAVITFF